MTRMGCTLTFSAESPLTDAPLLNGSYAVRTFVALAAAGGLSPVSSYIRSSSAELTNDNMSFIASGGSASPLK